MTGIREMSDVDLAQRALDLERDYVSLRFRHSRNQLEDTTALRRARRDLARVNTEARRREIAGGLDKGAILSSGGAGVGAARATSSSPAKGGFLSSVVDKLTSAE